MENSFIKILIFFLVFMLYESYAIRRNNNSGDGWRCSDGSAQYDIGLGRFAVDEHNKQMGTSLVYQTNVKACAKMVNSGRNWNMTIKALDNGAGKTYMALVFDIPLGKRTLLSFSGPI
ncbi:cysteine proteinase inhibitor 1-like [Rutidosis leptorrhynchoides]|uniref:cysteine proteinase inhibitor 1-like n=1 Tax=Rutidosis leptorrhynchoides TaxID=125765 RepID=UPI003A99CFC4